MAGCIFWLTAALQFISRSPISKTDRLTPKRLTEKCFGRQSRLHDLYLFLHALAGLPNRRLGSNEAQEAVHWHPISRSNLNQLLKKQRDVSFANQSFKLETFCTYPVGFHLQSLSNCEYLGKSYKSHAPQWSKRCL